MAEWREGRGEGGGPLVPEARRLKKEDVKEPVEIGDLRDIEEEEKRKERDREVAEVFGREELPVIERLDYEVSLPYPTPPNHPPPPFDPDAPEPEPFLLRFEGTHVLQGLRAAVEGGWADDGFPSWIGSVAKEGRNALRVTGRERRGVGARVEN